eukprot:5190737-Pyramimonas_sp.AAC.1
MGRPSRCHSFGGTPGVMSRGDGLGPRVDPASDPPADCLTEADYQSIDERDQSDRLHLAAPRYKSQPRSIESRISWDR